MKVLGFIPSWTVYVEELVNTTAKKPVDILELEHLSKLSFKYGAGPVNFHNTGQQ